MYADFSKLGKTNWSVYSHWLLSRIIVEPNEYVPSFCQKQEVTWKSQKPSNALKT